MAVTQKGWRPITVGEAKLHWRAIGTEYGIDVIVVSHLAFERGSSQQLKFNIAYFQQAKSASITPAVVRRAIEIAVAMEPPFTGGRSEPDSDEACEELNRLSRTSA
ncbi:MAG: hypothetical protein KC776_37250 [Myxococcales bacterium]|nr:hypothetical protein [Myxococcales bacterium]MCB9582232.1 hypothetical protein [Polyangiaceae bacterium]